MTLSRHGEVSVSWNHTVSAALNTAGVPPWAHRAPALCIRTAFVSLLRRQMGLDTSAAMSSEGSGHRPSCHGFASQKKSHCVSVGGSPHFPLPDPEHEGNQGVLFGPGSPRFLERRVRGPRGTRPQHGDFGPLISATVPVWPGLPFVLCEPRGRPAGTRVRVGLSPRVVTPSSGPGPSLTVEGTLKPARSPPSSISVVGRQDGASTAGALSPVPAEGKVTVGFVILTSPVTQRLTP